LVVVEEINDNERLHLRSDWTLFVGNKGVMILGVAFPKLGPRRAASSKEYFLNLGLSHRVLLLIGG
jgi:hypothetical protein